MSGAAWSLVGIAGDVLGDPAYYAYAWVDSTLRELTMHERQNLSRLPYAVAHVAVYDRPLTAGDLAALRGAAAHD